MKHVVGICTLISVALTVRCCLPSTLGLDINIHDTYQAIAFQGIAFWCLIGVAGDGCCSSPWPQCAALHKSTPIIGTRQQRAS